MFALVLILFAAVMPLAQNYQTIQYYKELKGTIHTQPGRVLTMLPTGWEQWLEEHCGDWLLLPFREVDELAFSGAKGSTVSDADLVYLERFTKLEALGLSNVPVSDAGLSHLKNLPQLKVMSFYDMQITDVGLVHLSELTNLETLYLNNTNITDAGLVHLKGLKKLKVLHLHHSIISYAEVKELEAALPDCNIFWTPRRKKRK